jgi:hypothetical protein
MRIIQCEPFEGLEQDRGESPVYGFLNSIAKVHNILSLPDNLYG